MLGLVAALGASVNAQTSPPDTTSNGADTTSADTTRARPVPDFIPLPDRWRDIVPPPTQFTVRGRKIDPYNQNRLKGDYPIIGQNTFLVLSASLDNFAELVRLPTPSGVSAANPGSEPFFGDPGQFFVSESLLLAGELFHGQTSFRPRDWAIRVATVANLNYANLNENNAVNVNPRKGETRRDDYIGIQELSFEKRLLSVSDRFDFTSLRAGIQAFNSDFRGFVFRDSNLGVRLFGNFSSNRYQYNLIYLDLLEKDTNSGLNTVFDDREQQVFVANVFRQDFIRPGYTAQLSFHYNHDDNSVYYDKNGFLVRPAVVGPFAPHEIKAYYLGWTGDGHFGKWNVSHAFYQVFGNDSDNPFAGREIDVNAQFAALELSLDADWRRYRASLLFASGDSEPADDTGRGFDAIVDEAFFAGGSFGYWQSQGLRLFNVGLVQKGSFLPTLRSSKAEGQANFVNPGLVLYNLGCDAELTPKLKTVLNASYLRFAYVASLERFVQQNNIDNSIGVDLSLGVVWRPLLNNNVVATVSGAGLVPMQGYEDIFETGDVQYAVRGSLVFTY